MEIKELKTKIKVKFPEESEIFMAEEFLEELNKVDISSKAVELDFSDVNSLDTVFLQIAASIIKKVNTTDNSVSLKSSEILENAEALYGIKLNSLVGGN